MRLLAFLAFLIVGCAAVASDRQISFIQQQPGHLDLVTLTQTGKNTLAIIRRFSAKPQEWNHQIKKEAFESIWIVVTGTEAARFEFTPGPSESMSDPKFYTITIHGAQKPISLRIPIATALPKTLADAIDQVRALIDKKAPNEH